MAWEYSKHGDDFMRLRDEALRPSVRSEEESDTSSACALYLSPTKRELLAVRFLDSGITMARPGLFPPPPRIHASKPPATADEAIIRFLLGLARRDRELTEGAVHWPEMRWARPRTPRLPGVPVRPEPGPAKDVMVKLLETQQPVWQLNLLKYPPDIAHGAMREAVLSGTGSRGKQRVDLDLGPPLEGLTVTARKVESAWYVVDATIPR